MNKHYAIDEAGRKHLRNSKSRVYSHTVVAQPSFKYEMDEAQRLTSTDASNYRYYFGILERGVGGQKHPNNSYIAHVKIEHHDFDEAVAQVGGMSCEEYQRKCARERIAQVVKEEQEGRYRSWSNLGWCGRYDLAQKLANTAGPRYCRVQILEAKTVAPKTKVDD